jgi:hypothetical protein
VPVGTWLHTINKVALHTERFGGQTHLITEDHARVATRFKAAGTTSAATTIVVQPKSGAAIVITDLIVAQDKVSSGSIIVQFTDGSNTIILLEAKTADAPVALHVPFSGRALGWKDARIEMISAGTNPKSNVSVVYYHVVGEGVLVFDDWDKLR